MRSADRGNQRESVQPVNHEDFAILSERLDGLLQDMANAVESYSMARSALEFSGDRRKRALADAFVEARSKNLSMGAGEVEQLARTLPGYKATIEQLYRDEITAENQKQHYDLLRIRVEVARSQLAVHRALIGML